MEWFEALILGLLQGLTEYLPVSSSGHLAIGSALFGIQGEDNLTFTIAVHVATVLSTLVILWKEIGWIFRGLFKFEMNAETKYVINILVSMIPIGIVGVFFKDYVEEIFGSGLLIVGCMLLLTALLLTFSYYAKPRLKENISMKDAFIVRFQHLPDCFFGIFEVLLFQTADYGVGVVCNLFNGKHILYLLLCFFITAKIEKMLIHCMKKYNKQQKI